MDGANAPKVTVVQPGAGDTVKLPGFGATYKLYSRDNGGEVAIVEHPFAVGAITAPHRHTREDEHSIVLDGQIGFRSDDSEVVLGPGGFECYFRELGDLLFASEHDGPRLHETDVFTKLADKYGLTYGNPVWLDDVLARFGLNMPTH